MVRKSQLGSPEFILTPAAPLELALKGMKTVEADLTARLSRQRNEDAKSAGLMKKLAQTQLEVLSKSGVDVGALAREVRQLRRQRAPKQAFPELLQSKVPEGLAVPGYSVVTPPYSYNWTATDYVDYAPAPPAILSASADPETGTLGFDDDSGDGTQVNISNAQAAVGIYFKPEHFGLLYVQSSVVINEIYGYTTWYAGCNARGWAGFLVQGYDANSLVETPVYQRYILFDEGSNGAWGSGEAKYNLVNLTFTTPWFSVNPLMWYAIWFWCGGDIHAEGWLDPQQVGAVWDTGSSASSSMDVSVPNFLLLFRKGKPPFARDKAKPKTIQAKAAKAKPKSAKKKSGRRR